MTFYQILFVRTKLQTLLVMMRYVDKRNLDKFSLKSKSLNPLTLIGQTPHYGSAKFYDDFKWYHDLL